MSLSCCGAVNEMRGRTDFVFALAGNPNVGKSSIFNTLTGTGAVTANYPGKTVEINVAATRLADLRIGLVDLPGTYALGAVSEDQWVARQGILDGNPDVVIVILDATNLTRNLYMLLQLLDMGFPVVAALNLFDQARKKGIEIDVGGLSRILGIPVIPTVATHGEGLETLLGAAVEAARASRGGGSRACAAATPASPVTRYGADIEQVVSRLSADIGRMLNGRAPHVGVRGLALLLLENDAQFTEIVREADQGPELLRVVQSAAEQIQREHGEEASLRIIRERHGLAGSIAEQVQSRGRDRELFSQRLWRLTTSPLTGMPILAAALAGIFAFLFVVGDFLARAFSSLWALVLSPLIQGAIHAAAGNTVFAKILIWGPDAGIQASLAVGIPYVLTFYFLLAFLEDSGYLNSVAFLTDRIMHRFGLHGRSIIPLVAGAGCNVPAIIGTRVLTTLRERTIASTLIVLVPCSARTAVVLGALAGLAGWQWGIAVFALMGVLVAVSGVALNKVMPGQSSGLVMEMFPFRMPSLKSIAVKTWHRFKDFIFVATPIVLGGSLALGALYETGLIWKLSGPLAPIMEGWLGLPAVAGLTLIFAILRKELALQLLLTLAIVRYGPHTKSLLDFMVPAQLFVYALVNTIYIPCVATVAVLGRELGWRRAAGIVAFTITLALLVGGAARWGLRALGIG
ncbi:MAG TPA: ferrous iron transport protein B [Spirochaetia bacterium]|nr:ferrous iron transport protein B [Spirochaetia bacterium]